MQNYLYCFDENYNTQATCSISSLLAKNSESINIYVIHKNPKSFDNYYKKLKNFKNLNKFTITEFNSEKKFFPSIENSHVSEATYYRFYLEQYLPSEVNEIMYIDADVICINDLAKSYYDYLDKLKKSNLIISVRTEQYKKKNQEVDLEDENNGFERLGLKSEKYFNAGVMLINVNKWKLDKIQEKLLHTQSLIEDKIMFWDQDVLNHSFDGRYLELGDNLNFDVSININENMEVLNFKDSSDINLSEVKLLHYSGKSKPWTVKGALHPLSNYYQSVYFDVFSRRYHIQNNWKKLALKHFLIVLLKNKLKYLNNPISFCFNFFRYLFK